MDSVIGFIGKDFVIIAADGCGKDVIVVRDDIQKIYPLQGDRLLSIIGEGNDRQVLADYIQRNVALNYYRNGFKSTTYSVAHWVSREVAKSLRKTEAISVI